MWAVTTSTKEFTHLGRRLRRWRDGLRSLDDLVDADDGAVVGHVLRHDRRSTHCCAEPDVHVAEDGGARTQNHARPNCWMSLRAACRLARCPEGDLMKACALCWHAACSSCGIRS